MNCLFCTKSISIFFSFKYLFLFIARETHVTPYNRRSDKVTSKVMSHVMSQDMSHIIWLGVWDTKCTDQVDYV